MDVVALSGGKDSTAMALELVRRNPSADYVYLTTPTGDELPDMAEHMQNLRERLGGEHVVVTSSTLDSLIEKFGAVPNFRMRWCTRMLKIEPCLAWIYRQTDPVRLHVGLRADEEERRGIFSDKVDTVFPMREWGWGIQDVRQCLAEAEITVPTRTDCARCYGQRLSEWWELWKSHPDIYEEAAAQERACDHTFRSAQRDSWPASLDDLRSEFQAGKLPPRARVNLDLFNDDVEARACRVCSL